MILHIKNMVCYRCRLVVEATLKKLQLHPLTIELGEVTLEEKSLTAEQYQNLTQALNDVGFEILDDQRSKMIEQIKTLLINLIHHQKEPPAKKYSELIAQHVHHDYSYVSNLFSEVEGMTIEQFIINQKIEKVKELLIYDELTLSEIAYLLHYSSVAHLSAQFKKITGWTPTQFKSLGIGKRKPLDAIGPSTS